MTLSVVHVESTSLIVGRLQAVLGMRGDRRRGGTSLGVAGFGGLHFSEVYPLWGPLIPEDQKGCTRRPCDRLGISGSRSSETCRGSLTALVGRDIHSNIEHLQVLDHADISTKRGSQYNNGIASHLKLFLTCCCASWSGRARPLPCVNTRMTPSGAVWLMPARDLAVLHSRTPRHVTA